MKGCSGKMALVLLLVLCVVTCAVDTGNQRTLYNLVDVSDDQLQKVSPSHTCAVQYIAKPTRKCVRAFCSSVSVCVSAKMQTHLAAFSRGLRVSASVSASSRKCSLHKLESIFDNTHARTDGRTHARTHARSLSLTLSYTHTHTRTNKLKHSMTHDAQ